MSIWTRLLMGETTISNRALIDKTAQLLESGAEPRAIVEWYDSLWKRPDKYGKPARQLIQTSNLPNAIQAHKLMKESLDQEYRLDCQYVELNISQAGYNWPGGLRWPSMCARCGKELAAGQGAMFTAVNARGGMAAMTTGRIELPVCARNACAVDPDSGLKRREPRYQLPLDLSSSHSGGEIFAHRSFMRAAQTLNPDILKGNVERVQKPLIIEWLHNRR